MTSILPIFNVKPRYWWQWFSPSFWKNRKAIKHLLEYEWEHGIKEKVIEQTKRTVFYNTKL